MSVRILVLFLILTITTFTELRKVKKGKFGRRDGSNSDLRGLTKETGDRNNGGQVWYVMSDDFEENSINVLDQSQMERSE